MSNLWFVLSRLARDRSALLGLVLILALAAPQAVRALAVGQAPARSLPGATLSASVTHWPWCGRVLYAATRAGCREVFVESRAALGASRSRRVAVHAMPRIASPSIVRPSI